MARSMAQKQQEEKLPCQRVWLEEQALQQQLQGIVLSVGNFMSCPFKKEMIHLHDWMLMGTNLLDLFDKGDIR